MSLRLWERSDPNVTGFQPPLDRYRWALAHLDVPFGTVADAACGCGYGTDFLAKHLAAHPLSSQVVGFDFSDEALAHARAHGYAGAWVQCDVGRQTFRGFDALVCLETIEHLHDPAVFVKNLEVPFLVISTTVHMDHPEIDPWHKQDFNAQTFRELLTPKFEIVDELQQEFPGVQGLEKYLTLACKRA